MSEIEKLYYNMDSNVLVELPETKEILEKLYEELGNDLILQHEDTITQLTSANEKQGFIYGFQYAVNLLLGRKEDFVGNLSV